MKKLRNVNEMVQATLNEKEDKAKSADHVEAEKLKKDILGRANTVGLNNKADGPEKMKMVKAKMDKMDVKGLQKLAKDMESADDADKYLAVIDKADGRSDM